jgi:hypothetical protein
VLKNIGLLPFGPFVSQRDEPVEIFLINHMGRSLRDAEHGACETCRRHRGDRSFIARDLVCLKGSGILESDRCDLQRAIR